MAAIDTVRRLYTAFEAGDLDAVMAECAPDAVVTQDPTLPWGGHFEGRDGIAEFALKLIGSIDSRVTIEELFEAGDQVVQYGRTAGTARESGKPFDVAECHIWTVRDGLVVEAQFFIDTPAMLEALAP